MATVQGSKWTPGGLVRARSRDWVVLPPDEPDVVRPRPVDGSDTEAVESLGQAVLEFLCRESALRLQRRRPVHPASVATINALLLG